jgi:hypothetical protein
MTTTTTPSANRTRTIRCADGADDIGGTETIEGTGDLEAVDEFGVIKGIAWVAELG